MCWVFFFLKLVIFKLDERATSGLKTTSGHRLARA